MRVILRFFFIIFLFFVFLIIMFSSESRQRCFIHSVIVRFHSTPYNTHQAHQASQRDPPESFTSSTWLNSFYLSLSFCFIYLLFFFFIMTQLFLLMLLLYNKKVRKHLKENNNINKKQWACGTSVEVQKQ